MIFGEVRRADVADEPLASDRKDHASYRLGTHTETLRFGTALSAAPPPRLVLAYG